MVLILTTKAKSMHAIEYIAERQYSWARRHGVPIDNAGYAATVNDNLFLPLTAESVRDFQAGAGRELEKNIRAAHSSSALVANVFDYWRLYGDIGPIMSAICPALKDYTILDIRFEARCPINWLAPPPVPVTPPHLDVVIGFRDSAEPEFTKAIAIESKFGELYTQDQGSFAERYLSPENAGIWTGLQPLREMANQIGDGKNGEILFRRLHVAQLIKHILGLNSQFRGTQNFELIYLWYPAPGQEAVEHEEEIRRFQMMTQACNPQVQFRAIKYQDLIHTLTKAQGDSHGAYIDYLSERYF
jgi:hypothetical protein